MSKGEKLTSEQVEELTDEANDALRESNEIYNQVEHANEQTGGIITNDEILEIAERTQKKIDDIIIENDDAIDSVRDSFVSPFSK